MSVSKKIFIVVLFGKLLILLVVLGFLGGERLVWGDGVAYLELGKGIFGGRGFSGEIQIMPLYPLIAGFFALFIPYGIVFLAFLQAIAAALIAFFIYKISLFFMPSPYAAGAAILASFEPVASAIHFLILTETFLMLSLLLFIYFFLKYLNDPSHLTYVIFSAISLGISILIKGIGVYVYVLPLVFILFFVRSPISKRSRDAAIFWVIFAAIIFPWMYRNYILVDSFKATLEGSGNICGYQLPLIFAVDQKINITTQSITDDPSYKPLLKRCHEQSELGNLFWIAKEYPFAFLKANFLALVSLFTNDGLATAFQKNILPLPPHHNYLTPMVFMGSTWKQNLLLGIEELSWYELVLVASIKLFRIALSLLALYGIFKVIFGKYNPQTLFVLLVCFYLLLATIVSTAFAAGARLRYVIDPLLFLFAFYGIYLVREREGIFR